MRPIIDPETIKPKTKGKADFYSWQLYKFIKNKPYYCHIYKGTWNSFDGYNKDKPVMYIGMKDRDNQCCFFGAALRQICVQGAKLKIWCMNSREHHVEEWEDITDWFFKEYQRIGVCAIHGDYAHNWVEDGDTRKCEYCGKREVKQHLWVPKGIWAEAQF